MNHPRITITCMLLAIAAAIPVAQGAGLNKWVVKGFDAIQKNKPKYALKYFQKAFDEAPKSAQFECYLGLGHFKNENYNAALHHYSRAAHQDPSVVDSAFLYYKASCYRALGLVTLERSTWKGLIQWDPDSKFADTAMRGLNNAASRKPAPVASIIASGEDLLDDVDSEKRLSFAATEYFREAYLQPNNQLSTDAAIRLAHTLNITLRHQDVLNLKGAIDAKHRYAAFWEMQRVLAMVGLKDWSGALTALEDMDFTANVAVHAEHLRIICNIELGNKDEALAGMPAAGNSADTEILALLNRLAQMSTATPLGK